MQLEQLKVFEIPWENMRPGHESFLPELPKGVIDFDEFQKNKQKEITEKMLPEQELTDWHAMCDTYDGFNYKLGHF